MTGIFNLYESLVVIKPTLEDSARTAVLEKVKTQIEKDNGVLIETNEWGRKKLAYRILNFREGDYVLFVFSAFSNTISDLLKMYKLDNDVIRYIVVKLDPKKRKPKEEPKEVSEISETPEQTLTEDGSTPVAEVPTVEPTTELPVEEVPQETEVPTVEPKTELSVEEVPQETEVPTVEPTTELPVEEVSKETEVSTEKPASDVTGEGDSGIVSASEVDVNLVESEKEVEVQSDDEKISVTPENVAVSEESESAKEDVESQSVDTEEEKVKPIVNSEETPAVEVKNEEIEKE